MNISVTFTITTCYLLINPTVLNMWTTFYFQVNFKLIIEITKMFSVVWIFSCKTSDILHIMCNISKLLIFRKNIFSTLILLISIATEKAQFSGRWLHRLTSPCMFQSRLPQPKNFCSWACCIFLLERSQLEEGCN